MGGRSHGVECEMCGVSWGGLGWDYDEHPQCPCVGEGKAVMDVERIRQALANTIVEADGVVHQSKHRGDQAAIAEAARLVVEAREVWWCMFDDLPAEQEQCDPWDDDHNHCGPVRLVPARLLVPPKEKT